MQIQNKHPKLHYMLCLGAGLRRQTADILRDGLTEEMRAKLELLLASQRQGQSESPGSGEKDG